jgi:hypothetical protein
MRYPKPEKRVKPKRRKQPNHGRRRVKKLVKKVRARKLTGKALDKLWSFKVKERASEFGCYLSGFDSMKCSDGFQAAHGFSRRYRGTRWRLSNGFILCPAHHVRFTFDPLGWTDILQTAWGLERYEQLKAMAQGRLKVDIEAEGALLGSAVYEPPPRPWECGEAA